MLSCISRLSFVSCAVIKQMKYIPVTTYLSRKKYDTAASTSVFEKFREFSDKLDSVPYLQLMNKGLPTVEQSLSEENRSDLKGVLAWQEKVFNYNVKDGKKVRGIALLRTFCALSSEKCLLDYDSDEWKRAVILAWCVEMLQAYFIMIDDIMDHSTMRRGKPCWYKQEDVGLCAINDALLLHCGIYKLLKQHFGALSCYNDLVHNFIDVNHKTVYGQCVDMLSNPVNERPRFSDFTFQTYQTLVEFKTSNYTYCLPVQLAMHLVGNATPEDFKRFHEICLKIGLYFQAQDDYLDVFGDPAVTGKWGNDIREGKCTWFAAKFLEKATPDQRKHFEQNYGVENESSVSKVFELYKNSKLPEEFEKFESELIESIYSELESLEIKQGSLFFNLLKQIEKRNK